jgi:hypothetical protein
MLYIEIPLHDNTLIMSPAVIEGYVCEAGEGQAAANGFTHPEHHGPALIITGPDTHTVYGAMPAGRFVQVPDSAGPARRLTAEEHAKLYETITKEG